MTRAGTLDDFWAIPEDERFHELIGGELLEKAAPTGEHADAQGGVLATLRGKFQRKPGGGGPGGWWILPRSKCFSAQLISFDLMSLVGAANTVPIGRRALP